MVTITLKGREIPLLYTVYEMKVIQEEIGPLDTVLYKATGRNREDEADLSGFGSAEHLSTIAKLVKILGNAGLEESGENPDLTEKKIMRAMKPKDVVIMMQACLQALREGMESEIAANYSSFQIDRDFFLGDLVEIVDEYGHEMTPRVTEVIESQDETGYTCIPTFANDEE